MVHGGGRVSTPVQELLQPGQPPGVAFRLESRPCWLLAADRVPPQPTACTTPLAPLRSTTQGPGSASQGQLAPGDSVHPRPPRGVEGRAGAGVQAWQRLGRFRGGVGAGPGPGPACLHCLALRFPQRQTQALPPAATRHCPEVPCWPFFPVHRLPTHIRARSSLRVQECPSPVLGEPVGRLPHYLAKEELPWDGLGTQGWAEASHRRQLRACSRTGPPFPQTGVQKHVCERLGSLWNLSPPGLGHDSACPQEPALATPIPAPRSLPDPSPCTGALQGEDGVPGAGWVLL